MYVCMYAYTPPSYVQGERLVKAVEAEVALAECSAGCEALRMGAEHAKEGEAGGELIKPSHPFGIKADAHIAKLDALLAAAQATEALDDVIQVRVYVYIYIYIYIYICIYIYMYIYIYHIYIYIYIHIDR